MSGDDAGLRKRIATSKKKCFMVINIWLALMARVTILGLSVGLSVCLSVSDCSHTRGQQSGIRVIPTTSVSQQVLKK